jgi:hypothetical protein
MDTLYDLWGSDTVHGNKITYSKIAIGLLDSLNRILPESDLRHNLQSRKRSLDSSPDMLSRRDGSIPRRFSERQGGHGGGDHSGGANRSDREPHHHHSSQSNRDDSLNSFQSNRDSPLSPLTLARAANLAISGGVAVAAASTIERLCGAVRPGERYFFQKNLPQCRGSRH